MLKMKPSEIDSLEASYPGIRAQILRFESAALPACSQCGAGDTADVQVGLVGRSINIAAATTKMKLLANGPRAGRYFCNSCGAFFDA